MTFPLRSRVCGSVRFDIRSSDHLAPFLGLCSDEPTEVGGRARVDRGTEVSKSRLDLGVGESGVNFLIESIDDFGGCVFGHAEALPCTRLEIWQEFAHAWNIG